MTWGGVDIGADDQINKTISGLPSADRSSTGDTSARPMTSFRYGFRESLTLLQKYIHTLGRYTAHSRDDMLVIRTPVVELLWSPPARLLVLSVAQVAPFSGFDNQLGSE